MTRSSRIVRTLTVLAAAVALLCTACGSGVPPARLVTSRYETATGHRIVRDCGFSVPLPGQAHRSLWLFCDTEVTGRGGRELGYPILGAGTAAEGPYTAGRGPGVLSELATPGADTPGVAGGAEGTGGAGRGLLPALAAPQPFLPVPTSLTLPGGTLPCSGPHTYPARWVTGAAREPGSSGRALISYADYCVSGPDVFTPEGFGLLGYDPAANALGPPAQVFAAPAGGQLPQQRQEVLGSPVFRGGYLYLFGLCGHSCRDRGGVFLARTAATAASWENGFSYRYWTGRGWSAALADAAALTGTAAPRGRVGRRLPGRRAGAGHSRADQRGGRLQRLAGGGTHRALAGNPDRPGPVHRRPAGRPVPRADRPPGAEYAGRPAHLVLQPRHQPRGGRGIPVVTLVRERRTWSRRTSQRPAWC